MSDLPILVCGLGRCGSSVTMQMLVLGGMRLTSGARWPFCEDQRTYSLPKENEWLREVTPEQALKLLNPDNYRAPPWFKFDGIWLDRKRDEQVKSWYKYGMTSKKYKEKQERMPEKELRFYLKQKTAKCRRIAAAMSRKFLRLDFEEIILDPYTVAVRINEAFDRHLDPVKMASAVAPRGPECLDGFLENSNLIPGAVRV